MFKTKIQNIFSRGPGALCSFLRGGPKNWSYATACDDCTLQSKQPWIHASYGLVKTRLICYVGIMRMFTRIGIRIIPVVTSAHLHIRIIPPALPVRYFPW